MGNLFSKKPAIYKPFDESNSSNSSSSSKNNKSPLEYNLVISRNTETIDRLNGQISILNIDLQIQREKTEKLERQLQRLEINMNSKYAELQFGVNANINVSDSNSKRINIITRDMENLLNNDKLLLEKMIEKNIVSTIQDN